MIWPRTRAKAKFSTPYGVISVCANSAIYGSLFWCGRRRCVSVTGKGRQDRAGAIKTWTEDGCEIKSISLIDPSSVSFGPDFSLLTFKSSVDGKCGGNAVPSENGISIYGKEAGAWKAVFTMSTPIM